MKIIIIGSSGAMGQAIIRYADSTQDIEIYAGLQKSPEKDELFPVFYNFKELAEYVAGQSIKPDIVIDFSSPALTNELLQFVKEQQLPLLLATTGLSDDQLALVKETSKYVPIFDTNNTSIGVAVVQKTIYQLTKTLYPLGYDIEIIEKHHRYKKDAPSGTALMLLEAAQQAIEETTEVIYGRSGIGEGRPHSEIAVHAIRGGDIVGEHIVLFANHHEVIEIKHQANNKELFVQGALACSEFLLQQTAGLYTMSDLMR